MTIKKNQKVAKEIKEHPNLKMNIKNTRNYKKN